MHRTTALLSSLLAFGFAATAQSAPAPKITDLPPLGARPTSAAAVPAANPATAGALMVPAQTPIELQLETHLSTRDNSYGDGFAARVLKSVFYQGQEVIPSGAIIEGHVLRVRDARPSVSDSELLLQPDLLSLPTGEHYTISAVVIQNDPLNPAKVDSEGVMREPRGMMTSDLHHVEAGTGGGLVGGALLAGSEGAATGAVVGAALGVGIWLARHRHLELNPGSRLTVKLERPLQLTPGAPAAPAGQ